MTRVVSAGAAVFVACSSTPTPAPIVVAEAPSASTVVSAPPRAEMLDAAPLPDKTPDATSMSASTDAETTSTAAADAGDACAQDGVPPFDCARLTLGQCSAAEYYACPRKAGFPEGKGFRPGTAARIGKCLAGPSFKPDDSCFKVTEACVREAVRATCIDPSVVATCEKELASCDKELRTLCAKLLSSLEPTTRKTALDDMRSQRKMRGGAKACAFSWDLNGFPFCPFCPFR